MPTQLPLSTQFFTWTTESGKSTSTEDVILKISFDCLWTKYILHESHQWMIWNGFTVFSCAVQTPWDFDSVLRNYCRIPPLYCGMWLTLTSKKWVLWMITMVTLFVLYPALFLSPCEKFLLVETGGQTSFLSCFRNTRKKLLLLSVSSFWRYTPEFEEAQLVHGISLMWGGNAFLQHHTSLWNHFLYYSLETVCNVVLESLLSGDIYHVKQYPQLEIHSQIFSLCFAGGEDSIAIAGSPVTENKGQG